MRLTGGQQMEASCTVMYRLISLWLQEDMWCMGFGCGKIRVGRGCRGVDKGKEFEEKDREVVLLCVLATATTSCVSTHSPSYPSQPDTHKRQTRRSKFHGTVRA